MKEKKNQIHTLYDSYNIYMKYLGKMIGSLISSSMVSSSSFENTVMLCDRILLSL